MRGFVQRFSADQSAATAIEYGLIAGLIALVVFAAMGVAFSAISTKFNIVSNAVASTSN
ncbi:MAG: Flp family type IVb pilin [Caulobacteraceae bacterium]